MGTKDDKSNKTNNSGHDDYYQNTAFDTIDKTYGDGLFYVEDDTGSYFPTPHIEDNSRKQEVETIFNNIFGRVGCYNCGLVGLDVKLNPEDIIQFDTQAKLIGKKSIVNDS